MTREKTAAWMRPLWCKMVLRLTLLAAVSVHFQSLAAQVQLSIRQAAAAVISISGPTGTVCQVQWAEDLADAGAWFHLGFCTLTNGTAEVTDATTADSQRRYYRVVQVPNTNTVLVPAGIFTLGSTLPEANYDEQPAHTLAVSAFYMDRYEVTKALWDEVLAWATNHGYQFSNPGLGKSPDHPVHSVNWCDAVKWCNARSEMEGFTPYYYADTNITVVYRVGSTSAPPVVWDASGYRLPTEAEWEKAARGGAVGQRFPWTDSDSIAHSRANYYSQAGFSYDKSLTPRYHPSFDNDPKPYTAPVGVFAANAYGLHDMAGNVAEWCNDWYDEFWYAKAEATGVDCRGPDLGSARVLRGGSWGADANNARCADRRADGDPPLVNYGIGFRCVRRPQ